MGNRYNQERRNIEVILSGSKTPEGRLKIEKIQSLKNASHEYNARTVLDSIISGVFVTIAILTQNGVIKINNEVIKLLSMCLELILAIILGDKIANNISKKNIINDKIYNLEEELLKIK